MKILFSILFSLILLAGNAQKKKKKDIESIQAMYGCYEIKFNFAETFVYDDEFESSDNYLSGGLEYVFPIEETKDKIMIQHLLVIGDTMIIKHWRQDWIYENQDFYRYQKNNGWEYTKLPKEEVAGQWTQKVFQVDDGPRYEGTASWVHTDGRHYWEGDADAPLPRRELKNKEHYNVLQRRNRHEITGFGWVHEQDNQKVLRSDKDVVIAREKGWNTYSKVDDSKCQLAKTWWSENAPYWADVRLVWNEIFDRNKDLKLEMKVDDQIMFMRLFSLGSEVAEQESYNSQETLSKIREIMNLHLVQDQKLSGLE